MYRLLIWGTGQEASNFISNLDTEKLQIVGFVESYPQKEIYMKKMVFKPEELHDLEYDYLIIASVYEQEIKETILQNSISENNIYSWNTDKVELLNLLPIKYNIYKKKMYLETKKLMPYQTIYVDNTYYLFNCKDQVISSMMVNYEETFSKKEIDALFEIAGIEKEGYFIDIGANIGTTSLYVKKNINPNLQIIAFEPVTENYNMFRINQILNNCEDIIIEKYGVSDCISESEIYVNDSNYGGSSIVDNGKSMVREKISCISLDEYFEKRNIEISEIKYIWVDVEGFEAKVILGGQNVLKKSKACLYMEFNAKDYQEQGLYNSLINVLKRIYSKFTCMEEYIRGKTEFRKIEELDHIDDNMGNRQINLLLMK